jgi:7-keto-8-aminopelargonate synthetase-like enzyme
MTSPQLTQNKWDFSSFAQSVRSLGLDEPSIADSPVGPTIVSRQEITNFAAVNFLNLHNRPDVMQAFCTGAQRYGLAIGGSRFTAGQGLTYAHQEMERGIAALAGRQRAVSFASGLLANIGFCHAMTHSLSVTKGVEIDNTDVVFVLDRDSHWSLWKGLEHLTYGDRLFSFKHNNCADLDRVLSDLSGKRVVVVFESVYSVDGSVAPMNQLIDVCERHGAMSYVDDANGWLVYGPSHRPFAFEYTGLKRATFVMVSMKKAVGLEGGAIVGSDDDILMLETHSGTAAFTAAMLPPAAAATSYIMKLLTVDEPEIVDNYLSKVVDFRKKLLDAGLPINDTPTFFTSIQVGDERTSMALRRACFARGYQVPSFSYPVTRRNQAVLRLILNNGHTDEHIDGLIETLTDLRRVYPFGTDPATPAPAVGTRPR